MPPGPPPNKGNGGVIALVIILVVVVIGGGGIAGWFLLSSGSSSSAGGGTDPTPAESTDDPVDDPVDDPTEDTGGSGGSSGGSIPENFAGTYSGVLTATGPDGSEEEWIIGISSTAGSDSGAISASVGSSNCTWDLELTSVSDTEMNMDYTEYGDNGGVCADPGTVTITDEGGSLDIEIKSKGSGGTTTAEGPLE